MKKILIIALAIWACCEACTQEKPGLYTGGGGLCFYYTGAGTYDSKPYPVSWKSGSVGANTLQDTLYFRIDVYGSRSEEPRRFRLKQSTLSALDSLSYYQSREVAVAGVNYMSFDDPEYQQYLVIPPDSSYVLVPVIMMYDPTCTPEYHGFQLHFEIDPTEELPIMDPRFYRATVQFSQAPWY